MMGRWRLTTWLVRSGSLGSGTALSGGVGHEGSRLLKAASKLSSKPELLSPSVFKIHCDDVSRKVRRVEGKEGGYGDGLEATGVGNRFPDANR